MSMFSKCVWVFGLSAVFLLVLATGRTNINNFRRVQDAIEEIYTDRLIVKGIIFDMASLVHQKELANAAGEPNFYRDLDPSIDEQFRERLEEFRKTKLTRGEENALNRLESNFEVLVSTEEELGLGDGGDLTSASIERLAAPLAALDRELHALSRIQLDEGRRKFMVGEQAVNDMDGVARVEGAMLALLGLLIIAVILRQPSGAE